MNTLHQKIQQFTLQLRQTPPESLHFDQLISFLQQIAIQVQVLEQNQNNISRQLYELYENVKINGHLKIVVVTPFNWRAFTNEKGIKIFASDLYQSTSLSIEGTPELVQENQRILKDKNVQIQNLKHEINNLEQRLEIQDKNCSWEINFYSQEREKFGKMLKEIVDEVVQHRKNNEKLKVKVDQLTLQNGELIKLYEEKKQQVEKVKKKKKYKIIKKYHQNKESLINQLDEKKLRNEHAQIQEKLCRIEGVGLISSSYQQF